MDGPHLSQLARRGRRAAARTTRPSRTSTGRTLTYADCSHAADRLATRLARWGVGRGDRVGLFLPKGLEAVAAIHGMLRSGAAYVPVDPTAPAAAGRGHPRRRRRQGRGRRRRAGRRPPRGTGPAPGPAPPDRRRRPGRRWPRADAAWDDVLADDAPSPLPPRRDRRRPRLHPLHLGLDRPAQGRHALARQRLHVPRLVRPDARPLRADDRFASHAPFHFDLSVFDLFASCRQRGDARPDRRGAGQGPGAARARSWPSGGSSVWYSAPSILALLTAVRRPRPPGLPAPPARPVRGRGLPDRPAAAAAGALAGRRRSGTSTGRPRPTSAPRTRSPTTIPDDRAEPFPIGRSARRCGRGWWTSGGATCRRDARRAGHRRPRRDAGLLRPARPDGAGVPPRRRRHRLVSHRRPGRRRRRRLLHLPRPPRPDGQEARLPDRAGRDRVGPLPPRGGRPRRGGRPARRRRASRSPRSSR